MSKLMIIKPTVSGHPCLGAVIINMLLTICLPYIPDFSGADGVEEDG
jgi:hypothetical protein